MYREPVNTIRSSRKPFSLVIFHILFQDMEYILGNFKPCLTSTDFLLMQIPTAVTTATGQDN